MTRRPFAEAAPMGLLCISVFLLNGAATHTQEIDELEHPGSACATEETVARSSSMLHKEETRGSLLQKSKLLLPPSIAAPLASEPGAEISQSGYAVSLLAEVEAMHFHSPRHPKIWLLLLAVPVSLCILASILVLVGGVQWKDGSQYHGNAAQMNRNGLQPVAARGSGSSAASLPPTPAMRAPPGSSQKNLPAGARTADFGRGMPPSPRQGVPMATSSQHLCPGLVVPHGNECILAVPILQSSDVQPLDMGVLSVQDLDGKSVMQAEIVKSHTAAMAQRPLVALRAGAAPRGPGQQSQPLLAYCKAGQEVGLRKSVYIYDAHNQLFAQIMKDPANSRYVLTSGRVTLQLFLEGEPKSHIVSVTNDQHQVLAETMPAVMSFNPAGFYYRLRVVSNVDVGLMLCSLLAMEYLEAS